MQDFAQAQNPMVIVGSTVLQRLDADAIHSAATTIATSVATPSSPQWNPLNVLHRVCT